MKNCLVSVVLLGAAAVASAESADKPLHWSTSWYAAPQPVWDASFVLPTQLPGAFDRQTLREKVRLSTGGQRIRLVFSNRYGSNPVQLGAVRVGRAGDAGPGQPVAFDGQARVSILPGATVSSDALRMPVQPLTELTVTTWLPAPTPVESFHWGSQQTVQVTAHAQAEQRFAGRLFLNAVLVEASKPQPTVVTLGDSITDGNGSSPDANRRWPDVLAERLAPYRVGVANAGISGGRLVSDGMGRSALARLDQDVLSQPGVSDVIVLFGINDIGWPGSPFAAGEAPMTAGTLPPFEGALEGTPFAGHYSPGKEALRQQFNAWIRSAGMFDAVVDFDALLRDPAHPGKLRPDYDSGYHLHRGDKGYRAMGEAVDIKGLTSAAIRHARSAGG